MLHKYYFLKYKSIYFDSFHNLATQKFNDDTPDIIYDSSNYHVYVSHSTYDISVYEVALD